VNDERFLRRYLLEELNQADMQALEERLMIDNDLFNLLLVCEDELIDDYVDGTLTAKRRKRFETAFLSTDERRRKVSFATAFSRYASATAGSAPIEVIHPRSSRWTQTFSSSNPYLKLAASVVIVLGLAFGIWRTLFNQSEVSKGMAALARAYSRERPVEPRISGLDYATLPNTRGGATDTHDSVDRDLAERILLDAVRQNPNASTHHAAGRLYLAERRYDDAKAQFEQALETDPNNAQLHNDYGVALFEKGKSRTGAKQQSNGIEELSKSIEQFDRALELNPNLLEALFNRALYHEFVILRREAIDDWQKYLEKDSTSKWASEARDHLRQLEEDRRSETRQPEDLLNDFVAAFESGDDAKQWNLASQAREAVTGNLIWWQLISAFFDARKTNDRNRSRTCLEALSHLGRMELDRAKDRFVSGLAAFYGERADANVEHLAEAHELINRGHSLCLKSEISDALAEFNRAREVFQRADDKWEACFAEYWMGYCYQRAGQSELGRSTLERLMQVCNDDRFLWVLAQATNTLGSIMLDTHNLSKATQYTKEALKISEQLSDGYGAHKNIAQLANQYKYIDDYQLSLDYMRRCLESARNFWPGARQMWRDYDTLAEVLSAMGLYTASADYEKESLLLALESLPDPAFIHVSYSHLGYIEAKLKSYQDAINHAQLGYDSVQHLSANPGGKGMMAYSSVELGNIQKQAGKVDQALQCYNRAIALLDNLDNIVIYEAYKGRFLCYIDQGNDQLAKGALDVVLKFAEDYRARILEEENRNKFFDVEQGLYDAAVDFQYSRLHSNEAAFELSETLRARSLLDLMRTTAEVSNTPGELEIKLPYVTRPLKLEEIRKGLPPDVQLLEYSVLDDKLLIWLLRDRCFNVQAVPIAASELKTRVLHYCELVSTASSSDEDVRRESESLYELLIRPIQSELDRNRQICVIPEKALNYLPFNTLVTPDGRYLINDYLLTFSPSANIYLLCSTEAAKKISVRDERVLSVGNPTIDPAAFPWLRDLPAAAREARKVVDCYGSGALLIDEHATKKAVKTELQNADVIHLASHYVVDERSPMLSKLLLAADETGEETGLLRADEIYREKPLRARLIVLSGCQTGVERYYNGEGMIGMSRMFIAAGVPMVIASLWPVDSNSTADLMIAFHEYRKHKHLSTAVALRKAQLDMLRSQDSRLQRPNLWAPFILIGGGSASF